MSITMYLNIQLKLQVYFDIVRTKQATEIPSIDHSKSITKDIHSRFIHAFVLGENWYSQQFVDANSVTIPKTVQWLCFC